MRWSYLIRTRPGRAPRPRCNAADTPCSCRAIVAQGVIGYTQYTLEIPAGIVILHIIGATAVFSLSVWFLLGLFEPVATSELVGERDGRIEADAARPSHDDSASPPDGANPHVGSPA